MKTIQDLVDEVLAGKNSAFAIEDFLSESSITTGTINQFKKDLTRMSKIYKDIKPDQEDEQVVLAKFNEARGLFNTFRKNLEKFVLLGLLGMSKTELSSGDPYFKNETSAQREVRIKYFDFAYEFGSTLFPESWSTRSQKHVPAVWELTDQKKKKLIDKYRRKFKEFADATLFLIKMEGDTVKNKTPDTIKVDINGFNLIITRPKVGDLGAFDKRVKGAIAILKAAIPLFIKRSMAVYPKLINKKIPLIYDNKYSLDQAASYDSIKRIVILNLSGISKDIKETARVITHEFGHIVYKDQLGGKAQKFWDSAIKDNYGSLDVDRVLKLWTNEGQSFLRFIDSLPDTDPDLYLQLTALAAGYVGKGGVNIHNKEDFIKNVENIPRVMKNPITFYAHKNPEEAFCEALSTYVIYGPRAVYPEVRSWLRIALPSAKINESEDSIDSMIKDVIDGSDPGDVLESFLYYHDPRYPSSFNWKQMCAGQDILVLVNRDDTEGSMSDRLDSIAKKYQD